MARPLRINRPGAWYHITGRANEGRTIYRNDSDRQHFCELLGQMVELFRVRLHGFVLMDNHYHLLIELREPNLSRAIQWLNVRYTIWFNRRHGRAGHLFRGRFKSVVFNPQEWALSLNRYVHLNPVRVGGPRLGKSRQQRQRAGAVGAPDPKLAQRRIALLRELRWSSYRFYIGLAAKPDWLECDEVLKLVGGKAAERRANYRKYVETAVREGLEERPWEGLHRQIVLGGQEFRRQLKAGKAPGGKKQKGDQWAAERPDFKSVIASVERVCGQKWAEFRDQYGHPGRDRALYLGRKYSGLSLKQLALAVRVKSDANVATVLHRYQMRLQTDRAEQKAIERATRFLKVGN